MSNPVRQETSRDLANEWRIIRLVFPDALRIEKVRVDDEREDFEVDLPDGRLVLAEVKARGQVDPRFTRAYFEGEEYWIAWKKIKRLTERAAEIGRVSCLIVETADGWIMVGRGARIRAEGRIEGYMKRKRPGDKPDRKFVVKVEMFDRIFHPKKAPSPTVGLFHQETQKPSRRVKASRKPCTCPCRCGGNRDTSVPFCWRCTNGYHHKCSALCGFIPGLGAREACRGGARAMSVR